MKRHALFVGVNHYNDKSIRPLRYSIPDASVLADRFKGLGYKTQLLSDPTEAELKAAVEESVAGLGRGDVFLFFFAGHGFTAQDGAHLLFCQDSRQKLLRVNDAGVKVNTLEALTNDGGFHRAFLLDSCRTDCFAGMEGRGGGTTRDLDFVAMPECTQASGSFFLLRSCDKFCPSLEFDSIGHGLFTQGLLDAMDAHDGRLAGCDTSFAAAVGAKMADIQSGYNVPVPQRPSIGGCSGPVFSLFNKDFLASDAENVRTRYAADEKARREAEAEARFAALMETGDVKTLVLPGGAEMEMIYCAPGEFMMGSPENEKGRHSDETLHHVKLTKGFWLGKYPVTQKQWMSVMGDNPSKFKGDSCPVERVSWDDCQTFIDKVTENTSRRFGGDARFPTEAEWEYACRAGTKSAYATTVMNAIKDSLSKMVFSGYTLQPAPLPFRLDAMGWYQGNSVTLLSWKGRTHSVGKKRPNEWGFHDMHGNVWEWCADWYGDYCGDTDDPTGPAPGGRRVLRGGSWYSIAADCRSARRYTDTPGNRYDSYGFRLCCSAGPRG